MSATLRLGIRTFTLLEVQMNSVERIMHYATNIDTEPPAIIEACRPGFGWMATPVQVELRSVSARHRPGMPRILKSISISIEPREKIGVVGRTGSGKSTLMLALFRMLDIEEGQIIINGIDISTIGLGDLRSRLCIIPQEPTLFSGLPSILLVFPAAWVASCVHAWGGGGGNFFLIPVSEGQPFLGKGIGEEIPRRTPAQGGC